MIELARPPIAPSSEDILQRLAQVETTINSQ
jgi:hypothetical protein